MYLSKIWFFLVAVAATVALTFALMMPRPAERSAIVDEEVRLKRACKVARILLRDNARTRVQLAGEFARTGAPANEPTLRLASILFNASRGEIVTPKENETGRRALDKILASFRGDAPDFVLLLDRQGRVVARHNKDGKDNDKFGETLRGYFLVDDALAGYLRDDLWTLGGKLYRVAASPVVTNNADWAGAVVIGHQMSSKFVESLANGLDVSVAFYAGGSQVAASNNAAINKDVLAKAEELEALEPGTDCDEGKPFQSSAGGTTYSILLSRLPGEAGELGAFASVFIERRAGIGFGGTIDSLRKDDLSPSNFPWVVVVLLFVVMVGVGLFLMIWEADKPLRKLSADAQRLSKGGDKLIEEQHRGKFGSIARSVNVALDRLRREAKSAQKDLDDLLGPAPAGGGAPMPAMNPAQMMPPPPPPPSEFKFSDSKPAQPAQVAPLNLPIPPPPSAGPIAPPVNAQVPPPPVSLPGAPPAHQSQPIAQPIDMPTEAETVQRMTPMVEDMPTIVSEQSQKLANHDAEVQHFRDIYEEFLATKRRCGESADNLNFERFSTKLRKNRDALIAKHGCRSVRFQVYVKDGKAALKASPEK